jgi:alpha-amylase
MSTKYWNDGDVHKYFSPYGSPYDAYINYMNIVSDLEMTIRTQAKNKIDLPATSLN